MRILRGRSLPSLFLCATFVSVGSATQGREVALVEDRRPAAAIVIDAAASAEDREAARELALFIEKATGAKLPVTNSVPAGRSALILVGTGVAPPDSAGALRRLRADGFVIRVSPDGTVVLAGNGVGGTSYAVYTFLEMFLGIRWLWPGELGEVVPKVSSLRLEPVSIEKEPAYELRRLGHFGAFPRRDEAEEKRPDEWADYQKTLGIEYHPEVMAQTRQWARRLQFGSKTIRGGHAFGAMVPPKHWGPIRPEYYALVGGRRLWDNYDGKHGAQLCTSNPEVVRLVTEYCVKTFDKHPDWRTISISPNDGGGFCECDRCRALDSGRTAIQNPDPEAGGGKVRIITDRIMTFANQVTEGVTGRHPDKQVSILAYGSYRQPPVRMKIHPSLNIQFHLRANTHWNPAA